ncbi:MAG: C4-dicarboxylate ABC transporter permease [SAR116 cluster bacterium]|nr:C4-dicarboxylate ABC transporter permease [SAR116 cluster bacterium]
MDTASSSGIMAGILWFVQGIFYSAVNIFTAISNPQLWLDWSDKKALMRFIYYGGSTELFFAFLLCFIIVVIAGLLNMRFMWGFVRATEGISNTVGRLVAWAGLLMVIQQVVIGFLQRIFARPDIVIGFGIPIEYGVSWFAEELKLYNAAIICLCISYTFIQQGHVRVDLFYAPASFRTKKIIEMCGAVFFMIPMAALMWLYSWFFMWRHLITPKVSASDKIELMLRKARVVKWNVETIGFSANGFSAYFLFKVLMVIMVAFIFLQAVSFFCRSLAEYREGEKTEGKFLDLDGKDAAPTAAANTPDQVRR